MKQGRVQGGIELVPQEGGVTLLRVDLPALQPPSDAFQADFYVSEELPHAARFLFGKMSAGRNYLSGVVEVTMSTASLALVEQSLRHVGPNQEGRTFLESVERFTTKWNLAPSRDNVQRLSNLVQAGVTKEASFVTSLTVMGFNDNDAAIALYRISPGAENRVNKDLNSLVVPLVRLDTSTAILLAFCQDVKKLSGATTT